MIIYELQLKNKRVTTVIYKDLATSTQKRNRFEIPLLLAVLGTKSTKLQTYAQLRTDSNIESKSLNNFSSLKKCSFLKLLNFRIG